MLGRGRQEDVEMAGGEASAMTDDALPDLAGRVRALGDRPLGEHPDVLEEVHRALVAELETLARTAEPTGEGTPADPV